MNRADAVTSDFSGERFFSRSPFSSGVFVTEVVFLVAVILASSALFASYWNRLTLLMKAFLFVIVCVRAVYSMWAALLKHKKIREAYFVGAAHIPPDSPAHIALDVAAKAILDDLFYLYNTHLAFLLVLGIILHNTG